MYFVRTCIYLLYKLFKLVSQAVPTALLILQFLFLNDFPKIITSSGVFIIIGNSKYILLITEIIDMAVSVPIPIPIMVMVHF